MEIEELATKVDNVINLFSSINSKLSKILSQLGAKEIGEALAEEEKENPIEKVETTVETVPIEEEEILMDLTDVTMMVMTKKAMLVTKKGFQKWIPLSCLATEVDGSEDGRYFKELVLSNTGKWIADKPWDKLEIRKRGGG